MFAVLQKGLMPDQLQSTTERFLYDGVIWPALKALLYYGLPALLVVLGARRVFFRPRHH
jgi:hypothetical protein